MNTHPLIADIFPEVYAYSFHLPFHSRDKIPKYFILFKNKKSFLSDGKFFLFNHGSSIIIELK